MALRIGLSLRVGLALALLAALPTPTVTQADDFVPSSTAASDDWLRDMPADDTATPYGRPTETPYGSGGSKGRSMAEKRKGPQKGGRKKRKSWLSTITGSGSEGGAEGKPYVPSTLALSYAPS